MSGANDSLAQQPLPAMAARANNRQNVFYPQARVTLSVIFEDFGEPRKPKVFPVHARDITVMSNHFKEADTFSLEFDARDLPFTPHQIRGGAVEIYLFQTLGIGQEPSVLRGKDDPETNLLEGLEPTLVGIFDESGIEFSDQGRVATITGTDYTVLFTSKPWDETKRAPTGKPLDRCLKELMSQVESADNMTLEFRPEGISIPTVGAASSKTNKKGVPHSTAKNYWDVMYDISILSGFTIFVEKTKVVVVELDSYVKSKKESIKKMAWGRNLSRLSMKRRIGKEQVPVIEVRSYDDKRRKTISARYPKNPAQKAVTGLGTKRDEVVVFTYHGITSEKQCESIAKQIYFTKARSEMTIEISTCDLLDLDGNDLIELKNSDALAIGFDPFNSEIELLDGQSEGRRIQTLKDLGYDPDVALEIANTYETCALFRAPFRVRDSTIRFNVDDGMTIDATLENYANIKKEAP